MAIQSVRVLADGWTLEVTGEWPASSPSDFALFDQPETVAGIALWDETTARVVLTCQSAGFNRVGLEAVGATRARQIVAHDVREDFTLWPDNPAKAGPDGAGFQAWPNPASLNRLLGEVDLGGGQRRIRLRLHKPVQPGDSFTVEFKGNWRAGLAGEVVSGAACVNDSATAIEAPSVRWLTAPYDGIRDTTFKRISVHAAHVLPEGKRGVAGVRFVATDGTNKVTAWADLGWDTEYGDNVRCWTANMDMTGLTAGPIVVHWSAFPWVGTPRHSSGGLDPATATASDLLPTDANFAFVGVDVRAENPLVFGYDPDGTYYGYTDLSATYHKYACVVVDPAGEVTAVPTTRAQAEPLFGFGPTPAAARAAALAIATAGRAQNTRVAQHAIRQLARTLPSAQVAGRGRAARAGGGVGDGIEMFLTDGTHVVGTGTAPGGQQVGEIWLRVVGNGKTLCNFHSAPSGDPRWTYANRARAVGLYARLDGTTWTDATNHYVHWQVCRLDRLPASAQTNLSVLQAVANRANFSYFNCDLEPGVGGGPNYGGPTGMGLIMRSCRYRTPISANVITDCTTYGPVNHTARFSHTPAFGSAPEASFDVHRWNNQHLGYQFDSASPAIVVPEVTVSGRRRCERFVLVNNLIEQTGGASTFLMRIGEGGSVPVDVVGLVIEGNTFTGSRVNWLYNDLDATNFTQSQDPLFGVFYRQCWNANNVFDHWAMKGSTFVDSGANSARAAALPAEPATNRAYLTQADASHQPFFGFMMESNVVNHLHVGTTERFTSENRGLRVLVPPTAVALPDPTNLDWLAFEDNRDRNHGGAGFGDYRASASAPWRALARHAQIDAGADGVVRTGATWAAGAMAGGSVSAPVENVPDTARHLFGSTAGFLTFTPPVAAVNAAASWLPLGNRAPQLSADSGEVAGGPWRRIRVGPESRFQVPEGD